MESNSAILKILNIERSEVKFVLWPVVYSFFLGAAIAYFFTGSTSLFLSGFERDMIPLSFIIAGIIVISVGQIYSYLQSKFRFSLTVIGALAFLLISVILFIVFFSISRSIIVIFALYAWNRVFAYIHNVAFWGMAGKLFSLQQAKRVFGLISGGEVIGLIVAFFSVPVLLKFVNTESLLFIATMFLLAGFAVLLLIVKKFKIKFAQTKNIAVSKKQKKTIDAKKIGFLSNNYYKLFFIIAFLPVFAQFFVDFIFQAQVKVEFPQKESLTAFVGMFFGISAVVEFFLKTFISGRLMTKYGVKFGLLAFPVVMAFSFALASFAGLLYGTVGLFFSFVTLGRLFTRAVRTSFNDPATQILYQPLPPDERLSFQNKIESGPKAYASIAAGVILYAFAKIPSFSLVYFSIFLLVVIAIWTKSAVEIYKEYKQILQKVLSGENKMKPADKIELVFDLLIEKIKKSTTEHKAAFIKLFESVFPYRLANIADKELDELDAAAFKPHKLKELVKFSKSPTISKRIIAANGLSAYPTYKVERLLTFLLKDENYDVRRAAIISVGRLKATELYPYLLNNFRTNKYRDIVVSAMINIGHGILYDLNLFFRKIDYEPSLQIKTIEVFEKIGGEQVVDILRPKINYPNKMVSNRVIDALGNLNYQPTQQERVMLSQQLKIEIRNYVYISAAMMDFAGWAENREIVKALKAEKKVKKRKIFALLSVIYDSFAIRLIYENLERNDAHSRGFAIEIADTVVDELHKNILLPIFDDLTDKELVNKYKDIFVFVHLSVKDRLADIINSEYSVTGFYTKAVAITRLQPFEITSIIRILKTNIIHPDQLVREAAAITLFNKDKTIFEEQINRFLPNLPELKYLAEKIMGGEHNRRLLIHEKMILLKGFALFKDVSDVLLSDFAKYSTEEIIDKNDTLTIDYRNKSVLHIPISGKIVNLDTRKTVEQGAVISSIDGTDEDSVLVLLAIEKTFLLRVEGYLLTNLLVNDFKFAKKYIDGI